MTIKVEDILTNLELGFAAFAGDGALDETIGAGLRSIDFSILSGVLEALVPAEVWKKQVSLKL
jgi:hypothetical protein